MDRWSDRVVDEDSARASELARRLIETRGSFLKPLTMRSQDHAIWGELSSHLVEILQFLTACQIEEPQGTEGSEVGQILDAGAVRQVEFFESR